MSSNPPEKKFILIDGNALVHRAFHALPALTSPNGMVTNAAFGFASILIRTIKDLKPDYIAAAFDRAEPTFRHDEFSEYKIHRAKAPQELYDQIPVVKGILKAFGIPVYEKSGYEADDIIGTIAKRMAKQKDIKIIIATGDLDTLQLVEGKHVVVLTLKRGMGDTMIYDQKKVIERYGLKPEQLNDFKGLKGDPSDNIPGVPGIGDKTASYLIQKFGSIENLYKELERHAETDRPQTMKSKQKNTLTDRLIKKLLENKEQALFSKHLSTIVTDIKIDISLKDTRWKKNADFEQIRELFKKYGFRTLLQRLDELNNNQSSLLEVSPKGQQANNTGQQSTLNNNKTLHILAEKELSELVKKVKKNKSIALYQDNGLIYGTAGDKQIFKLASDSLLLKSPKLKGLLENPDIELSAHNAKPLVKHFMQNSIHPQNIFDTMLASYMLSTGIYISGKDSYSLPRVYQSLFNEALAERAELMPQAIMKLKRQLLKNLHGSKSEKALKDIELPLIPVLADMELLGIKIDTTRIKDLLKFTKRELAVLEKKIHSLAEIKFNISSPQQLSEVLFERLQIKGRMRKTSGGARSTAAPELEKIRDKHKIVDLILKYRELKKLKTTYIEPFAQWVAKDGRVHTTYNQAGTATGRLSSQNPNLQNIPIRTKLGQEFRKAFIAKQGYRLVSCDYSQIELRMAAHIAQDKKMISAFKKGEDIHTRTAAEIFNVPPQEVTKRMRRQAKVLNFGIIYGMGSAGFARAAGVDLSTARDFIERYFKEFSGVAKYIKDTKKLTKKNGYVETLFGHRRHIPEIHSTMPQLRAQAERMAVNMPLQGTAADIVKLAMIKTHKYIRTGFKEGEVKLLLQIHDELLFEIKKELIKEVSAELKKIMEGVAKLAIPLVVDVKEGANWQDMNAMQ